MVAVTAQEMRAIDRHAIEYLGIPSIVLMENAALRVIDTIDLSIRHSFGIFCGTGNNGGDGLAIARGLLALEKRVHVFVVGSRDHMSPDFKTNYRVLEALDCPIRWIETLGDLEDFKKEIATVNTLIDCLFGTGLSRDIRGTAAVVIEQMNESRIHTISVDMPSGIDATDGRAYGVFVEASEIVTLQFMKQGLVNNPLVRGRVRVVPIGIPPKSIQAILGKDYRALRS